MRRLTAIFVLGVIALFTGGPLLAVRSSGSEASLPACCRKHGGHHCAMMDEYFKSARRGQTQVAAQPQHCPFYPHSLPATGFTLHAAPPTSRAFYAEVFRHPAIHPQTQAMYRLSLDRARQKRGPPALTLL